MIPKRKGYTKCPYCRKRMGLDPDPRWKGWYICSCGATRNPTDSRLWKRRRKKS